MAIHSPIEQFEVHDFSSRLFDLAGHPVTFTNASMCMVLAVILSFSLLTIPMRRKALVPGRWQMLTEMFYNTISNTLLEAAGEKAKPFTPFILSLFLYIMFCNLLGMFPHVYTVTSQLVVNFVLAMTVIGVVIVTGFIKHGSHFFSLFLPKGVPWTLAPLLAVLEAISFFIRPCSLSLRLFANMLAGHILMKVFAGMSAAVATAGWVGAVSVLPVILNIVIVAFEFFVALLQAYIFTILSSVYLRDALELH